MALVPTGVTTVMSVTPAACAGEVAVIWVPPRATVMSVPGPAPNMTALAPVKLVPVMVTEVPPVARPATGLSPLTLGTPS